MNSEEFRAFYRQYYDVSVKVASKIVQSHFTAEDVTQEVFLYFYRIKDRLDISSEKNYMRWCSRKQPTKAETTSGNLT